MIAHYMIIAMCGSTEFEREFREEEKKLTEAGYIVLTPGTFVESEVSSDMQMRKIDMADIVYVINKDGYIDERTKGLVDYAEKTGCKVYYLEED